MADYPPDQPFAAPPSGSTLPPLSFSQIARTYRPIVGRDISTAAAIVHGARSNDLLELVEALWETIEAKRMRTAEMLDSVATLHDDPPVSLPVTAAQLTQLWESVDRQWQKHGLGHYHSWFQRHEHRFAERSGQWNIEPIVNAAQKEADMLITRGARHGLSLAGKTAMTVIGAEAFRLAPALAPRLHSYLGVELCEKHRELARFCLSERQLGNAQTSSLTDFRATQSPCDLFYSTRALQYAPPPLMKEMLKLGLQSLSPGGFAYFQLPCQLHDYRFVPAAYLAGKGRDRSGELHALPQQEVLALMDRLGVRALEVIPDGSVEHHGLSYLFIGRKSDI